MKPVVNHECCIGCGTCVAICPNVFQLRDDGKSNVVNPKGASEEEIKKAADACPVQCISME